MDQQNYQSSIAADFTPNKAFAAIGQVTEWWVRDVEGSSKKLNDVFTVRFSNGTFVTFKVTENVPDKKIAWLVTDCYLPWLKDKTEWNGTTVAFEISPSGDKTQVTMTHIGLVTGIECYEGCEAGWNKYFKGSLFKLLTEHVGVPQE